MLGKVALMTAVYAYLIANAGSPEAIWLASETASREKRRLQERIQSEVKDILEIDEDVTKNMAKRRRRLKEKIMYWTGRAGEAVKSVESLSQDEEVMKLVEMLSSSIESTAKEEEKLALKTIDEYARAEGLKLPRARKPERKRSKSAQRK
ncbi:MAG: hypothetical protein ACLFVP_09990 [Candidatus Bathyarchaeia archaeon]